MFDEAGEEIKRGIAVNNQHAPFYYCLGSLHYLKDENEQAIRSLQISVSLDRGYRDPRFLLACLYRLENDYNNARNILNELQPLAPDMIQVHEMLGDIYVEIGMLDLAKDEYEAVLKAEPDNNEVRFKADVMGML
jgi:tetratricopeptide (TPR) repeat protein